MTQHAIRIEDCHYAYPPPLPGAAEVAALRGISLTIESGEFLAVMGPTGAGKTTLCLALNGLVPQSTGGLFRGDVWIGDRNTKAHPVAELSTHVGIVFQEAESQLFTMSVEDEIAFGLETLGLPADEIERRITWALETVGLTDLRWRSPAHLSGGQQQRLALAAVLAMQPAVLVLDEPTAGLDPLGRRGVLDAVAGLRRRGMTIIMATQDADATARLADRVLVLESGTVVTVGTPPHVFGRGERLPALGVGVPQMAELSHRRGVQPPWLTVRQATQGLRPNHGHECGDQPRPQSPSPLSGEGEVGQPAAAFEDVCYRYEESVEALTRMNLRVLRGEYVALIGANGSGKTTLGKHVNGLLRPQAGRVLVAGDDTRRQSPGELARRVGYVFQNPDHQIFAATVRDEIAFGPRNVGLARAGVERRVADALETFQLTALADIPPATLGYGQRRLVTLASVHAMQPEILVLDEPSTGLDGALTARLVEWVRQLHRSGATVLFITHDMRLAALAGRCVVLAGGRVMLDASPAEVFACPEALARAGIAPPPIARLSQQLGMAGTPLSVDAFCHLLARQHEEVDAP